MLIFFSPSLSTRKHQTSIKDFSKQLREQTQSYGETINNNIPVEVAFNIGKVNPFPPWESFF